MIRKFPLVNRVEVIDHTKPYEQGGGRAYVRDPRAHPGPVAVSIDIQDDGRTLKVFIERPTDVPK